MEHDPVTWWGSKTLTTDVFRRSSRGRGFLTGVDCPHSRDFQFMDTRVPLGTSDTDCDMTLRFPTGERQRRKVWKENEKVGGSGEGCEGVGSVVDDIFW